MIGRYGILFGDFRTSDNRKRTPRSQAEKEEGKLINQFHSVAKNQLGTEEKASPSWKMISFAKSAFHVLFPPRIRFKLSSHGE
jgi:hypothetical protein